MEKQLVIVTGAASGIGKATAQAFSEAGHPLLLLDLRKDRLEDLGLPNAICKKLDVTDRIAFKLAVEEAEKEFGAADCIVNCAGMMLLGSVEKQNPLEWDMMIDINVKGVLAGMSAVLDNMIQRKSGTIINISSIAGRKTFPNHSVYCGTKFAVHAITENVREEAAKHNVRLITIAPGVVETELLSHTTSDEIKDNYNDWKKAVGKVLEPGDIARSILFAYNQPQYICVREIVLAATHQEP